MNKHKRLIFSLGAAVVTLAVGGAALLGGLSTSSDSLYMTDGPVYKNVSELTRASSAVAHVRVVEIGKSYRVSFDPAVVHVAPPRTGADKGSNPSGLGDARSVAAASPRRPGGAPQAAPGSDPNRTGILVTDVTVEVMEPVHGGTLRKGDRLQITQLGGTDERGKLIVTEHDPALRVGDQEIVFLHPGTDPAKFSTTGGSQGRFKVVANNTLQPIDSESGLARATTGKPASVLKAEVQSVH